MVKDLLLNNGTRIHPGIQRIVWLYKRWQPLYMVIQNSVVPKVEFIKGIPSDLEDDDYFDSRINNLLIIDDLFSEAGKDKRVTDLFTEGSHHRSLSVISINQNLFGNKDPTQRRNCHYLLLFNNPVDKQSVMTLARQMYPGHTDKFLKMFAKATKHPYGHLIVDLKPFTPDNQRLKCLTHEQHIANDHNLEPTRHVTLDKAIKEEHVPEFRHSSVGVQTGHIAEDILAANMDKGQACDDCGQLFDSVHDVQRHVKSGWCPELREQKKRKHEEISDSDQEDESVKDNQAYTQLWKRAKEANEEKYEKLFNTFIDNGEHSDDAQEMAEERIQSYNERAFFSKYITLIDTYILPLRHNGIHQKIMSRIDKLMSKGMNSTSAVKRVLRKYNFAFQDCFDIDEENGEEEQTDDEDSEEGSDIENE